MSHDDDELLDHRVDDYECVQIVDSRLLSNPTDTKWFDRVLNHSLQHWAQQKHKAIWLQLKSPTHLHLVPLLTKYGFYPHHCQPHYIMFVKWMDASSVNQLPSPAQHAIGVGAVVINSRNQVLMVQENSGPASKFKIWKLPGGLVDSHELMADAVVRELKEETGVDATFNSIGCIIEMMRRYNAPRKGKHGKTMSAIDPFYVVSPARGSNTRDMYCMCLCQINGDDNEMKLVRQKSEIADVRFFDLDTVFKMPLWRKQSGVWSAGLQACVDIHCGKLKGIRHEVLPFAFGKGEASIYRCKL